MRRNPDSFKALAIALMSLAWAACGTSSDNAAPPAATGGSAGVAGQDAGPDGSAGAGGNDDAGTAGAAGTAGTAGTGGGTDAGDAGDAPEDVEAEAGPNHARPPSAGAQKSGDGTGVATLAVSRWYFGDTNRDGSANKTDGWKQYGYDLDGELSTPGSTDLCKPLGNANPKNVYPDGDDGIDNSFGKNLLPMFLGLDPKSSTQANDALQAGKPRMLIQIDKIGASADYNPLASRIYQGADLGAAPKYDGTDAWPVMPESLVDPADVTTAKLSLPAAYLAANTWVSGSEVSIVIPYFFGGTLNIPIRHAVVTMQLDAARKKATMGTIAGVVVVDELLVEMTKTMGSFDPSLCDPSSATAQSILAQLSQAADILSDMTQDPAKTCDAISIGIGFDADLVQLGAIAPSTASAPARPRALISRSTRNSRSRSGTRITRALVSVAARGSTIRLRARLAGARRTHLGSTVDRRRSGAVACTIARRRRQHAACIARGAAARLRCTRLRARCGLRAVACASA
jgi:hypothetical protein